MKYKAEIFDRLQYLFEETGFNDHQLHCVIRFENKLDAGVMESAVLLLLKAVPLLSCAYRHNNGDSFWETADISGSGDLFTVAESKADFDAFTVSRTNESTGPQIRVCLHSSSADSLSVIMNHMVCDAAGFKECVYLLSDLYSALLKDPGYMPAHTFNGDRSMQPVTAQIRFSDKIKALLFQGRESNQRKELLFPLSRDENTAPFILTHEIGAERMAVLHDYCRRNNATINDAVLAAYYRALAKTTGMEGKPLNLPIMIDMRRYLQDKTADSFTNLSSTVITRITVDCGETFQETLMKVNREMKARKANQMGINGFVKLALLFKLFNGRTGYSIIKKNLKNPYICMTNIGILDPGRLIFEGSPAADAFMCGSIKYRPHFQIALSSFAGRMTFSSNLYGSSEDRRIILNFFSLLDQELPQQDRADCGVSGLD